MIVSQPASDHTGKVIASITGGTFLSDLVMCGEVRIKFTDGSELHLATDWRGSECYISQIDP